MNVKDIPAQLQVQHCDKIVREVLKRLPAKSNFRFRCVSKNWFHLNSKALEHQRKTIEVSAQSLSFLPKHFGMETIHDSSNGLVVCQIMEEAGKSGVYVCNPATRKYIKIPYDYTNGFQIIKLDFNPQISLHFNLIMLMSVNRTSSLPKRIETFSSKVGEWKVGQMLDFGLRLYIRDALLIYDGLFLCLDDKNLIGLDFEGNRRHRIGLPGNPNSSGRDGWLCSLNACLSQSAGHLQYHYQFEEEVYVWELVSFDSGSWSLKARFGVKDLIRRNIVSKDRISWTQTIRFSNDTDEVLLIGIRDDVHSYNMETGQWTELNSACHYRFYCTCYFGEFGNKKEAEEEEEKN